MSQKRILRKDQSREKATESQWGLIDIAVKAFISKYPRHWYAFQQMLKTERSEYNLAKDGDLKKANWRNTASFPVIYNSAGEEADALLPVLNKIIPALTHKDSINYAEFLRRYPCFLPAEKY